LQSFPPEHSPFKHRVLLGNAQKNSPVSSPFAMS
jgi:hypothetical protein